jgi:hypothetical protein
MRARSLARRRLPAVTALSALVLGGLLPAAMAHAEPCLDEPAYARLLARHTFPVQDLAGVAVDYDALRAGSPDLDAVLESLDACDPETLPTQRDRMAFWINAYNILAIDLVVKNDPPESIRDIGSFFSPVWKKPAGTVNGQTVTLHQIEHEILRPMEEPLIHGAIVCASQSCPALRRTPYTGANLKRELTEQMTAFLRDRRKGARLDGRVLRLSKIFQWFKGDFDPYGGVVPFVRTYADFEPGRKPRLDYFDYDWSLNAFKGRNAAPQSLQ